MSIAAKGSVSNREILESDCLPLAAVFASGGQKNSTEASIHRGGAEDAEEEHFFVCRETTTNKKVYPLKIPNNCLAAGLEFLPNRRLPIGQKGNSLRTQRLYGY